MKMNAVAQISQDEAKRRAAARAAEFVRPGMRLGLGTGSTAAFFVDILGAMVRDGLDVVGVPTSERTRAQAQSLGIRLSTLEETPELDLTVDGADEFDSKLRLIKGGGGALLREKLVWEASRRCVVIADAAKRVPALGAFPLPIEVVAFGHATTLGRIEAVLQDFGLAVFPHLRLRDGAPMRTDNGNLIYDAACGAIEDPAGLAAALKAVTGVVEHGLFLNLADTALVGTDQGVVTLGV